MLFKCWFCKREKPIEQFYQQRDRGFDQSGNICKVCFHGERVNANVVPVSTVNPLSLAKVFEEIDKMVAARRG